MPVRESDRRRLDLISELEAYVNSLSLKEKAKFAKMLASMSKSILAALGETKEEPVDRKKISSRCDGCGETPCGATRYGWLGPSDDA